MRQLAIAAVAAPLSLALAACGSGGLDTEAGLSGDPIEKIAPPEGKAWSEVVAKTPEGGYVMGNPEAPIKLVEYGSLTCSHCAEFAETSKVEIKDTFVDSGRVSYEFRNFVRDAIDLTAAQLTRCAAPESFFALSDQVFLNQQAMLEKAQAAGEATYKSAMEQPDDKRGLALAEMTGLLDFFAARGVSKDQGTACLANAADAQALAKSTQDDSAKYNITGTPTFLLNGSKIEVNTWPEVKAALEKAGAR
ncbi:MAG: thioredoxin domain-containing protein [Novosphingobium sp.]|nr:thioredoxin domain-containing protein [Novosphingobium sp.]